MLSSQPFSIALVLVQVTGELGSISVYFGLGPFILAPMENLEASVKQICMILECGRKLEYLEKTHEHIPTPHIPRSESPTSELH